MGGSEEAVLMVCWSHDVSLIVIWIKSGAVYELMASRTVNLCEIKSEFLEEDFPDLASEQTEA